MQRLSGFGLAPLTLLMFIAGLGQSLWAQSQQYTVTDIGFPWGASLNDKGQVAGGILIKQVGQNFYWHPFIWDAANGVQDLGVPPGFDSAAAFGINGQGHVAGNAISFSQNNLQVFYWDPASGFVEPGINSGAGYADSSPVGPCCIMTETDEVIGYTIPSSGYGEAFFWNPISGIVNLPPPCQAPSASYSTATSRNGAFAVGAVTCNADPQNPQFYYAYWNGGFWTALTNPATGVQGLDVNNLGQVVGTAYGPGNLFDHAVLWTNNVPRYLGDLPGASGSRPWSINDSGQVVGCSLDANSSCRAFVWDSYNGMQDLNNLVPPDTGFTLLDAAAINNAGQIVVIGRPIQGQGDHTLLLDPHGPVTLLDPVPSLLSGAAVVGDTTQQGADALATSGQIVQGGAADGVTELVLRIKAATVGQQFVLTLLNDQGQQSHSADEDGALGNPGDVTFSQSQITVSAVSTTTQGPTAFAIYRVPVDFPRPAGQDMNSAMRTVSVQVQSGNQSPLNSSITILRPPVILVHGLWDGPTTWDQFYPLYANGNSADPGSRFSVSTVKYNNRVPGVTGTFPLYSPGVWLLWGRANALGFQFNANSVLSQIQTDIGSFKNNSNPAGIQAAAVQADIVAHSMGGDIVRTLPLQPSFLNDVTFGQGSIHKLITIDTPHLGSPVAADPQFGLLANANTCVRNFLASVGNVALSSVTMGDGSTVTGAVGDLQGDGQGGALSLALQNIQNSGSHSLPTALIAGIVNSTNLNGLATSVNANAILQICGLNPGAMDPLALALTPSAWPTVFGQPSDAIVPLSSQLANLNPSMAYEAFGFVHSGGAETLGFTGPAVLPSAADENGQFPQQVLQQVPNQVINLLNTTVTNPLFIQLNP